MEDHICPAEKYSVKNIYIKNILLEWKNIYMIKMFLVEYKFIMTE